MILKWLKSLVARFTKKNKPRSANVARERLMVIVAHERNNRTEAPDFLPMLEKEITGVIARHVRLDQDQVSVEFEQRGGRSILELNITLPEGAAVKPVSVPHVVENENVVIIPQTKEIDMVAKKKTAKKTTAKKTTAKKTTAKKKSKK